MHTENQHICLVGTETTKVPALDLYKNSKSENKNLPFFNYEKVEHIRQKIKIWASWLVSREMGCDMNGTYYYSHGTNTYQSESSGNDNCARDIITRSYARFFNAKTINSVSIISIER